MKANEIQILAERVLASTLPGAPFESVTTDLRPNHADEDSIFVTVRYRAGRGGTSAGATADATIALRDALRAAGEERYPYLSYVYPDDPPPYVPEMDAAE